jgi:tRNA pseudouridine55 synthase
VPPAYSAAKLTGQRAYDLARQGREVSLEPRAVQVHAIDVLRYDYPELDVEVRCGKGTYIRSLARDLGERLDCGAYVGALRRTRVGPFAVEDAVTLQTPPEEARARLLPMERAVADLPRVTLGGRDLERLRGGQAVRPASGGRQPPEGQEEVAVFDHAGALVAVAVVDRGLLRPAKVVG